MGLLYELVKLLKYILKYIDTMFRYVSYKVVDRLIANGSIGRIASSYEAKVKGTQKGRLDFAALPVYRSLLNRALEILNWRCRSLDMGFQKLYPSPRTIELQNQVHNALHVCTEEPSLEERIGE